MKSKINNPFHDNDFKSGDGMMTSVWGPAMWHVMHTISFNYPIEPTKEQKKEYYNFYNNLQYVLPCKYCRENLKNNLKKIPLDPKTTMESRETLSKWVYDLHEEVNTMLGKKSNLLYEDVKVRYEMFRSRCLKPPSSKKKTKKTPETQMNKKTKKKEKGCVKSLYGVKSKCVIHIVPKEENPESFVVDPQCNIKN
jgi:hypothetical protein